jgi:IrrE N-terminal-like domain
MRRQYSAEAIAQAKAMLTVLDAHHAGALLALRDDPLGELGRWPQLQVRLVAELHSEGACSVAGSYQHQATPPALVVSRSRSIRRRGFTALHELGHHLQQTDPDLGQRLFSVENSELLEERACDAFAARVLLPDDGVAAHISPRGPTATAVAELFRNSRASREACCVRAAEHLIGAGVVVLLDQDGTVLFAAPRGLIPPARGSDQSDTPLIAAALKGTDTVERDQTVLTYRGGNTSDLVYGQASWCDPGYLIAVVVSDNVPWRRFAPPRPHTNHSRYGSWWTCETCAQEFQVNEPPCDRCGQPRCESLHCGCTASRARRDRTCDMCHMTLHPSRFEGDRTTCRDCAG